MEVNFPFHDHELAGAVVYTFVHKVNAFFLFFEDLEHVFQIFVGEAFLFSLLGQFQPVVFTFLGILRLVRVLIQEFGLLQLVLDVIKADQ